jgi:hypothetical protein
LYFSWSNIDEIHGDFQHKHVPRLTGNINLVSPDNILKEVSAKIDSINAILLVNILQKPYYSISFFSKEHLINILADAQTGSIREPINREEAIQIAASNFNGEPGLKSVEFLTSTSRHHEYREKPLPAWAITFDHPTNTTVYVSLILGK